MFWSRFFQDLFHHPGCKNWYLWVFCIQWIISTMKTCFRDQEKKKKKGSPSTLCTFCFVWLCAVVWWTGVTVQVKPHLFLENSWMKGLSERMWFVLHLLQVAPILGVTCWAARKRGSQLLSDFSSCWFGRTMYLSVKRSVFICTDEEVSFQKEGGGVGPPHPRAETRGGRLLAPPRASAVRWPCSGVPQNESGAIWQPVMESRTEAHANEGELQLADDYSKTSGNLYWGGRLCSLSWSATGRVEVSSQSAAPDAQHGCLTGLVLRCAAHANKRVQLQSAALTASTSESTGLPCERSQRLTENRRWMFCSDALTRKNKNEQTKKQIK